MEFGGLGAHPLPPLVLGPSDPGTVGWVGGRGGHTSYPRHRRVRGEGAADHLIPAPEVDSRPALLQGGCARRQQRQWHVFTGFAGMDAPRAMFPTFVDSSAGKVCIGRRAVFFLGILDIFP